MAPTTLRLPFALAASDLRIGELQYEAAAPLRDIAARIELGHDAGREHRVPALTLRADRATASGSARIGADAPFALDAQVQAASVEGSPRPWQASAKASGPLAAIAVTAQLTSPQAAGAQLDAEATVSPFAAWPLSQLLARTRALDLSALFAEAPQTQIAGEARIDTQGLDKPITASIKLTNAQAGRWDERRLPLAEIELDIAGRADQRDQLTLRRFALRAPGSGGVATGQGEWKGGTATVDITLQALRPALLDNRAPAMTLSGSLGSRWLGLPSPDGTSAADSTLQLQSKLALEGRLDGRRGGKGGEAVRIDAGLQVERNADTLRLALSDAQARAGAASLRGALQAERSGNGALQVKTQGQAQGFDPASWWGTAPAARLNGAWKAELQAPSSWRFEAQNAASWLALRGKSELDVQNSTLAGVPLQAHAARRCRRGRLERRCQGQRRQQPGRAARAARRARRRRSLACRHRRAHAGRAAPAGGRAGAECGHRGPRRRRQRPGAGQWPLAGGAHERHAARQRATRRPLRCHADRRVMASLTRA